MGRAGCETILCALQRPIASRRMSFAFLHDADKDIFQGRRDRTDMKDFLKVWPPSRPGVGTLHGGMKAWSVWLKKGKSLMPFIARQVREAEGMDGIKFIDRFRKCRFFEAVGTVGGGE